jgi:hypothetical protein
MKVWIVDEGICYTDTCSLHSVHVTKKSAEAQARNDGFRFNKADDMFVNKDDQEYRKIHAEEVIEVLAFPKAYVEKE